MSRHNGLGEDSVKKRDSVKLFRFFVVFHKLFDSDAFECTRMQSDAFGCDRSVRTFSKLFRNLWISLLFWALLILWLSSLRTDLFSSLAPGGLYTARTSIGLEAIPCIEMPSAKELSKTVCVVAARMLFLTMMATPYPWCLCWVLSAVGGGLGAEPYVVVVLFE